MSNRNWKFIGDRENASFRHTIVLKPEARIGKVKELEGYSKHKHHEELADKVKCFAEYLSRISCAYLSKSVVIEFHSNNRQGKDNDDLLCYVTAGKYWIHPRFINVTSIIDLLNKAVTIGLQPEDKPKKVLKRTDYDKLFIYQKDKFKSEKELGEYCRKLMDDGLPPGRVEGYYFDVRSKYDLR